jgi:hypothetical protein
MSPLDPEVPEADALEQSQPVVPEPSGSAVAPMPNLPLEADEADVLDQAREVPVEDDDWR